MIFVGLMLLGIAVANGMELQAFLDVFEEETFAVVFGLATFLAVLGDLKRL